MYRVLFMLAGPMTVAIGLIAAARVDNDFSHDIGQPTEVVVQALQAADIVGQPHTQAKLSEADRERPPQLTVQREADGISWFVMSGGKSVLKMKAQLTPASGGGTHVRTSVEQGELREAPDVPKLFTSPSDMAPLFAVAVERALGEYIPKSERSLYSQQERPWGYEPRHTRVSSEWDPSRRDPYVSFEPGKPMVRPSGY